MLRQSLVIARKEIVDGFRDVRSVISAVSYALMGPVVVGMVAFAVRSNTKAGSNALVLAGMMSVFALVAAFVGGMNVAMDTIAGERERRSLLPLLLNPVTRLDIVLGKWLGVCVFAIAGLALNLLGFAVVFAASGMRVNGAWPRFLPAITVGIFSLPLLAASIQLLISTLSRGIKEAQTYLSLIVFLPMGLGMFLVFFPAANRGWCGMMPVLGQQIELQLLMNAREPGLLQSVALAILTTALSIFALLLAANRLQRDEIVYGE